MEIWLSYNNYEQSLQLPVHPPEIRVVVANLNRVIPIAQAGEILAIGRSGLAELEIASHFPAEWRPYCAYSDIPRPYDAVALIDSWRLSRRPIRLTITETPINMPVAIDHFEWGERAGSRDVDYTLQLTEFRFVTVQRVDAFVVKAPAGAGVAAATVRPDTKPQAKTYTVKSGDSLSTIAKRVYGDSSRWQQIYIANKQAIGSDPNKLKVGLVLVIP